MMPTSDVKHKVKKAEKELRGSVVVAKGCVVEPPTTPEERANRAYKNILQTVQLNEKLRQLGIATGSFGLRKSAAR